MFVSNPDHKLNIRRPNHHWFFYIYRSMLLQVVVAG